MILEYMLIKENDKMRAPSWVEDGGYFRDPDNFTMVGWTPAEGVREYYVPDTVLKLTLEQLVARVLDINSRYPMKNMDDVVLTDEEVIAMVTAWYNSKEQQ